MEFLCQYIDDDDGNGWGGVVVFFDGKTVKLLHK